MRLIITTLALALALAPNSGSAQIQVQIPDRIKVADMELHIQEGAKTTLTTYVSKLVSNNKYFRQMVDRADAYLPIVERIFQEEGLPDDFKYLVIQESSLVSHLVSTSNAVGYWQFKKETAVEMGLRVDEEIDERMAIVPASKSAAKYLIRHNHYMQNWVYSLLGYYAGLGGAKALINPEKIGSKTLDIDENTHWYILKFIAHKIAFEPHLYRNTASPNLRIQEFAECENKTLEQISKETNYPLDQLQFYNRWVLKGYVPGDRDYTIILPIKPEEGVVFDSPVYVRASPSVDKLEPWREKMLFGLIEKPVTQSEPVVLADGKTEIPVFFDWNGIKAIQAKKGDNSSRLALLAGIGRDEFLEYNDLRIFDPIVPGEVYYADNKKNKAKIPFHTVQHGETLWEVAQKYGLRMKSLMAKNRMQRPEKLKPGRVLWMRHIRPEDEPIRFEAVAEPAKPQAPKAPVLQTNAIAEKRIDSARMKKAEARAMAIIGKDSLPQTETTISPAEVALTAKVESEIKPDSNKPVVENQTIVSQNQTPVEPEQVALVSSNNSPVLTEKLAEPKPEKAALVMPEVVEGTITALEGMTWYRISRHYHKSLDSLQAWNGNDQNLMAGRKIYLERKLQTNFQPKAEKIQDKVTAVEMGKLPLETAVLVESYQVMAGESCYGIARKFGMKVDRFLQINGKEQPILKTGEIVKVEKMP